MKLSSRWIAGSLVRWSGLRYRRSNKTIGTSEGIWENGYEDKYVDLVKSMCPGERIAIKSSYTRKHDLPFDNRGQSVSVMAIKAIGVISSNPKDGKLVTVKWTRVEPVREWYFYTQRGTVWRVLPGDWMTDGLVAFAFGSQPQDIERFRNAPFWRERYGAVSSDEQRFKWTGFYEAIADKLALFRSNRPALIEGLKEVLSQTEGAGYLTDKFPDGTKGFLNDICPFTTMGTFNRGIRDDKRKLLAGRLAQFLGVSEPVPETFEGIPILNNQRSWYFPYASERAADHIDALWDVFLAAISLANSSDRDEDLRAGFAKAFDNAIGLPVVGWNLTMGLYWARPWAFVTLDNNSKAYIATKLQVPIGLHGPKKRCSSADYFAVMNAVEPRFQEASYPVHSFPRVISASMEEQSGRDIGDHE